MTKKQVKKERARKKRYKKEKARAKARAKAKLTTQQVRATETTKQRAELRMERHSRVGRHAVGGQIQARWRCIRKLCKNIHGTCWNYPVTDKHYKVGKNKLKLWALEAMDDTQDTTIENPPYSMVATWTTHTNQQAETNRIVALVPPMVLATTPSISPLPSTSFNIPSTSSTSFATPSAHPSLAGTTFNFINNSGNMDGHEYCPTRRSSPARDELPQHNRPFLQDFAPSSNQIVLPLRPSSAVDTSVEDKEVWENFEAYCIFALDKQYLDKVNIVIKRCILVDESLEQFKFFSYEQKKELDITSGIYDRMRALISRFKVQFKGQEEIIDARCARRLEAAETLESLAKGVIPTVEEDNQEDESSDSDESTEDTLILEDIKRIKIERAGSRGQSAVSQRSLKYIDGGTISSNDSDNNGEGSLESDEEEISEDESTLPTQRENNDGEEEEVID
jgi:hypothetical protein